MQVLAALLALPALLLVACGQEPNDTELSPREYVYERCTGWPTSEPGLRQVYGQTWGEAADALAEGPTLDVPRQFREYDAALGVFRDALIRRVRELPPDETSRTYLPYSPLPPGLEGPAYVWDAVVALRNEWYALDDDSRLLLRRIGCTDHDKLAGLLLEPPHRGECAAGGAYEALQAVVEEEVGPIDRRSGGSRRHTEDTYIVRGGVLGYHHYEVVHTWETTMDFTLDDVRYEAAGIVDDDCEVEVEYIRPEGTG